MDWLSELIHNNIFLLFLIISLGKLIERIKIRGFSLGIASIFIIAAVFGHFGAQLPSDFASFGLALFVYCIGIETGPQFIASFNKKAASWLPVPLLHFAFSMVLTVLLMAALGSFSGGTFLGLYSGSLTSTPAMASVYGHELDKTITAAYGLMYPIALIGSIYLIPALPRLFRHNIAEASARFMDSMGKAVVRELRLFRVTNPNLLGRQFSTLKSFSLRDVIFTRIIDNGISRLASDELILKENSIVAVVGNPIELEKLLLLIGPAETAASAIDTGTLQVKRIIISNPEIAGKTLAELDIDHNFDAKITRVVRSSVEMSPLIVKQIQLGDKIIAIGTEEGMARLTKFLGDDVEESMKTQFAPISIGVMLGMFAGHIPLPFLHYTFGMTGGILLCAMFLGYKVKFLGILWQIPHQTNAFLKQLSLYIFFAALGTSAGKELIGILVNPQSILLLAGCVILAFLPIIAVYAVSTGVMKKNPLEVIGILAGDLNNSSVILSINEHLKTDIPNAAFAFTYPLGLILAILSTELLYVLLAFF